MIFRQVVYVIFRRFKNIMPILVDPGFNNFIHNKLPAAEKGPGLLVV
jgi:hypothetical protein